LVSTSWDLQGEVPAALRVIVSDPDYGVAALSNPQTLSSLLKDLLPDAPREAGVLVAAAQVGLPGVVRDYRVQGMDRGTASALAEKSLAGRTALTPEACHWVVGELAAAVGFGTSTSPQARRAQGTAAPSANGKTTPSSALEGITSPPAQGSPPALRDSTGPGPGKQFVGASHAAALAANPPASGAGHHRAAGRRKLSKLWTVGAAVALAAAVALTW